jgi:hypothetical protein
LSVVGYRKKRVADFLAATGNQQPAADNQQPVAPA